MADDWKDEIVEKHTGGITDLITSSPSDFQQESVNLAVNKKINALSTREGYKHVNYVPAPSKIRQLFKLEDNIIAYCSATESDPLTTIDGQAYYRFEREFKNVGWNQVITPRARGSVRFNISNAAGKGFNIVFPVHLDSFIFHQFSNGAGPSYSPVPGSDLTSMSVLLGVDAARLNSLKQYDRGSLGMMTWSFFQGAALFGSGVVTLFANTLPTDLVEFTGQLTVQAVVGYRGLPTEATRSIGAGAQLPIFNESGHIQTSEWAAHLYMAHEPFDKSFAPNPLDIYAEDPDTYPPDNQRLPLRRLAAVASEPGVTPPGYPLAVVNAQLPKTFIGVDTGATTDGIYTNAIRTYQFMRIASTFPYAGTKHVTAAVPVPLANFTIWSERTWGRAGLVTDMGAADYFAISSVASKDRDLLDNVFTLVDFNDSGVAPYPAITWGKLYLVWHSSTGKSMLKYKDMIAAVEDAFRRYNENPRSAYPPFGWFVEPDPKAYFDDDVTVTTGALRPMVINWNASLPEGTTGNYQYGYAFYLRDQYFAEFEGAPREFQFDGPTSFIQVRTLGKIGMPNLKTYFGSGKTTFQEFSTTIPIWGGIAARMRRDTDLYNYANITSIFARTTAQGEVFYIDQTSDVWYRTENMVPPGGTLLPASLVAENWEVTTGFVVNGQSTTVDEDLVFNEEAYFNGGVLSYDSLPQGPFFFTICNQVGYYAEVVGNIQRVFQSAPGVVHSSPVTLFSDFDDQLTAISAYLDKPMVFTAIKTWRIEGVRTADGQGRSVLRTVSDEYGCISNQSVVVTNIGVFYWSQSGIVYSNGLEAFRVTEHLIDRYAGWVEDMREKSNDPSFLDPVNVAIKQLRGTFDEQNRLIYWSCWDSKQKPFQVVLSLDQPGPMMPVRIYDGVRRHDWVGSPTTPSVPVDFFQTHACLYSEDTRQFYRSQDSHLLVNNFNQTYDETHIQTNPPASPVPIFMKAPIVLLFKSIGFSYGVPWAKKITSKMIMNFRDMNHKGVSLTPLGWNDLTIEPHYLASCLNFQHIDWQADYTIPDGPVGPTPENLDLEHFFRQEDVQWKAEHVVAYKRRFPKGKIRNLYKQVGFKSLLYRYGAIFTKETPHVMEIKVTVSQGNIINEPWVVVHITVPLAYAGIPGLDPVLDLSLDTSGQFYLTWEEGQQPMQIQKLDPDAGPFGSTIYRMYVLNNNPDLLTNLSQFTYFWPEVRFYRYFTDQHIDLLGYSLTYRIIGARTHGMHKSVQLGGNDA